MDIISLPQLLLPQCRTAAVTITPVEVAAIKDPTTGNANIPPMIKPATSTTPNVHNTTFFIVLKIPPSSVKSIYRNEVSIDNNALCSMFITPSAK